MKKMTLPDLEIKSFITKINDRNINTIKGGTDIPEDIVCPTSIPPESDIMK